MDREQQQRERAYKIWEDEGRPEGRREDHWQRAEEQHEQTERESADATEANQRASEDFNGEKTIPGSPARARPPSMVNPD